MGKNINYKIKILFCINSLDTGGAEKQLVYISNYLSSFFEVHILLLERKKINYAINKKIFVHYGNKNLIISNHLKIINNIKPKCIFFILPKTYYIIATKLLFKNKIKKILMRRSLNYYHKNIIYKYYEKFLHKFTNYFICNSKEAKKNLIKNENVDKKKVAVIYNYISKEKNLKKVNTTKNFNILYIANFYKYKDHFLLLLTLSLIKNINWKLYLLGQDRDLNKKQVYDYAKKLGISHKLVFLKKKRDFSFPKINLGVSFSKTESFPNSILEYLSFRLPIMAYSTGDTKLMVNKKNGILFTSREPRRLSLIIKKLINQKDLKKKSFFSGKKFLKFSKKNFTLIKYKKIIEKICVE